MYCTIEATWKGTAKWSQRRRVWIRKWFHDRPFNLLPCLCNLARILVQRSSGLIEIETDVHTTSRCRFLEKTIHSCLLTRPKHSFLLVETLLFSLKSWFCRHKKILVQPLSFLVIVFLFKTDFWLVESCAIARLWLLKSRFQKIESPLGQHCSFACALCKINQSSCI